MSDDDDDFDGEKTQIFLPGKDKPGAAAPDHSRDREGIQLKPRSSEAAREAGGNVDFDITGEHEKPAAPAPGAAPAKRAGSSAPKRPAPAARPSASPSPIVIVAVVVVIASLAWVMLR